jgi:fatty-acyl-CoA synthase
MTESAKYLQQPAVGKDRRAVPTKVVEATRSAYGYPLLIKNLLHTPLCHAPDQEIVYRDVLRYDYRTLEQRIGRLANGLASLGVLPGDTVGVLDWDSHRYLECYFAVPGMGAVLHMVNVRLSPEQILYTINHAEALQLAADLVPGEQIEYAGLDGAFLAHCQLRRWRVVLWNQWFDANVYPPPPATAPEKTRIPITISAR